VVIWDSDNFYIDVVFAILWYFNLDGNKTAACFTTLVVVPLKTVNKEYQVVKFE
jgi:hypothetical protein